MSSDFGLSKVGDIDAAFRLRTSRFQFTPRPWLDLYGVNIRPVAPFGSASSKPYVDHALIHRCLPDELFYEVFARMSPYSLGRAACVCRKWRYTIRNPLFWRSACLKAWQVSGVAENYKILQSTYQGSWRKMWLLRPRIRTDGLYVSRNTYIRAGVAEWKVTNPVHLVCYYRYMRFFSSGRFLYKNSSQKLKDVVKFMNFRVSKAETVFNGHYTLSDDKVEAALLYPGLRPTVLRIRLRLRGTTAGANNRMDVISLITSGVNDNEINGREEDMLGVVGEWQEDETHNADVPAVSHMRGMAPFVFVPFEEAGCKCICFSDEEVGEGSEEISEREAEEIEEIKWSDLDGKRAGLLEKGEAKVVAASPEKGGVAVMLESVAGSSTQVLEAVNL